MAIEKRELSRQEMTSKGLPVISEDTIRTIRSQFTSGGEGKRWGDQLEEVKSRLIRENPNLVKFVESQVSKYPKKLHEPMFEVIVGAVAVLEHQASANRMGEFVVGEPPESKQ